jgi:hypothetical protein
LRKLKSRRKLSNMRKEMRRKEIGGGNYGRRLRKMR